jgi:predicted naringenin-chalcone synthase
MEIYNLSTHPSGYDLSVRSTHFAKQVDRIFEEYYPEGATAPNDLIHVSCTGYLSPSGAQKIASKRNWGHQTTITHAYHMGCYGSIPAIRMAGGFLAYDADKTRVDIVHTELCSIHTDPANHSLGALVAQSLFADGFIKYSASKQGQGPHFRVVAIQEEIIPNSTKAMTWDVSNWGFEISLAKEVPVFITRALVPFLERLAKQAGIDKERLLKHAFFAVHPGGPKILLQVQEALHLSDAQMQESFTILKQYGNMSSATLPHIWKALLEDPNVPDGTPLVSLAFGPGLSITGSVMEKICGS